MFGYTDLNHKTELINQGKISLSENVYSFLQRIEDNKHLNAFISLFPEEALEQAKIIEKKIRSGKHGKLAGAVIAVKDVIAVKNKPLTCASKALNNFVSLYNASSVQHLLDEDAIIIGKTNCDEFAMGSSNENSAFGNVLNPVDISRVPGGSSGGSAAAVKAGLCDAALGTDTGGSVRQPAAFCGLYGLKPTYGRISRFGLTAFASSFDTIGLFTNNIKDSSLILEVLSGKDNKDSTSSPLPVPDYPSFLNSKIKYKIGIPKEFYSEGLSADIKLSIENLLSKIENEGHQIIDVDLPYTEYCIAVYYILSTAEASSNLARYDGVRFGFRSKEISNLDDLYINSRTESFGNEVKRRIMLGTYVLSAGYYDAFYRKAQKVRRLIKQDYLNAFQKVDILLTPTTPGTAFRIGEKSDNPLEMYLNDIYTTSANLAGIPGLNIPGGIDSSGLPIGIQLLSGHFKEEKILDFASQITYFNTK